MKYLVSATAALVAGIFGSVALAAQPHSEFRQFSCELDNDYVVFTLRHTEDIWVVGAKSYSVNFQVGGPVIRLPPEYYSPNWSDVKDIKFERLADDPGYGRLSLRISGATGASYTQAVGIVQRACWEAAKQFIVSRGIVAHFSETEARGGK
jgi:hypothetical protein